MSEVYVTAEYLKEAARLTEQVKQTSYQFMQLNEGDSVLDVGCGPGMDTIPLAKIVGDTGRVIGVDSDQVMLDEADAYARQEDVDQFTIHQLADVKQLPFTDNTFDAVRAERLLQVLPDSYSSKEVIKELVRVVKPGAAMVLADTDWGSYSIHSHQVDMENTLIHFFATRMRPKGYIGRQLLTLLKEQELHGIELKVFPLTIFQLEKTPIKWMCDEAKKAKLYSEEDINQWYGELEKLDAKGQFYCSVNMVVARANKQR